MLATIEAAKQIFSFPETEPASSTTIYGLIPKPEDGIEAIKLLWNRRTASSYQKILLDLDITNTIWRNAKSGAVFQWNPQMLSDIGKKEGVVVENYINMNILPIFTQQRLALENMGICRMQILKNYNSLQKNNNSIDIQRQNLTLKFRELNAEINYYPGLLDLEDNLGDILAIVPWLVECVGGNKSFDDFINGFERARFEKLDGLVRSSEWTDNCLQMQEIYQKRLFRFRYGSFDEYCKSSKLTGGMRRVKIGEVIRQLQDTGLPLPKNRGQAFALSEIPTENRRNIWQSTIESNQKLSARLILQIHAQAIGSKVDPELASDPAPMIGKIDVIIAQLPSHFVPESAQTFLAKIRRVNLCSPLEIKMLRAMATSLQDSLKSAQLLEIIPKSLI